MHPRSDAMPRDTRSVRPTLSGGWAVAECRLSSGKVAPAGRRRLPGALFNELARSIRRSGLPSTALPLEHHIAFVGSPRSDGKVRLIVVDDDALSGLMNARMHSARIAPAELRLLKQLLGGMTLHEAAASDAVGYETKRSQYKSLAKKLRVRSQLDLTGSTLTQIMLHLEGLSDRRRDAPTRKSTDAVA